MLKKLIVLFAGACALLWGGCKNDIDTNADWKEILVVYGLLNVNDNVHYIRVNRAFLSENQSALEVAKINDSLYFDSIEVKIDEFDEFGSFKSSNILVKDVSLTKDTGIFANYPNVVYRLNKVLDPRWTYKLEVTNKLSGHKAKAETKLVNNPTLGSPSFFSVNYDIDTAKDLLLNWTGGKNSKVYDLTMRFYYEEYDSATNTLLDSNKFIDWPMAQNREVPFSGSVRSNISGRNFYIYMSSNIPHKVGVFRKAKKIDFMYWGADNEFYLYRSVNQPSIGIVQKKPEYTNISGGNYGLFASRNSLVIPNVTISARTKNYLQIYPITQHLKFRP